MNNIQLYQKIDELVLSGPSKIKAKNLRTILGDRYDLILRFFSKIDQAWFIWLWKNGFLDTIKQKKEDPTKYSYQMPELLYLQRMVQKIPAQVVDFMLEVKVSKETFNPEVVGQFLRICTSLSADQLARLIPKIHGEKWVPLMDRFNGYGFEYAELLKKIVNAHDETSLLLLAEAVLSVRSKDEMEKLYSSALNSPFYFTNFDDFGIFEYLANISDENREGALKIVSRAWKEVTELGDKDGETFEYRESYSFYDVDFFTLAIQSEGSWPRDDVKDLAATNKILIQRMIGGDCLQEAESQEVVEKYVNSIPESRTIWRFKLFVWSLCPELFKQELENAFFRVFEVENPFQIAGGAEYDQALMLGFKVLSDEKKRHFITLVFKRFTEEKNKSFGSGIIRSIKGQLTEEEAEKARKSFTEFDKPYDPRPTVGVIRSGMVTPKAPGESEKVWLDSVESVVRHLKSSLSPADLVKDHPGADFLAPVNAEGVGNRLQTEIKKRIKDYLEMAESFFDRRGLDSHYTYSYLQGLREAIRGDYEAAKMLDWKPFINMALAIRASGESEPFKKESRDRSAYGWLANWTGVHMALTDVLQELLNEDRGSLIDFKTSRQHLLTIFEYLLSYPDPVPSDEKIETATSRTKSPNDEEYQVSDPLTIAINSVRGRAFQAFLQFVYQDSKGEEKKVLSEDIKKLYEKVLEQEKTQAIMFMFGQYLYFFFYRDREWVTGLIPKIFTQDSSKRPLCIAAWEGYLSSNLFKELFELLEPEYQRAINLESSTYPEGRNYRSDLDEALGTHLALAYIHYDDFGLDAPLFVAFWEKANAKRHGAFISFAGRHVVTRERKEEWYLERKQIIDEKLKKAWDWILAHCNEPEALEEFGYWMTTKSSIFETAWLAERIKKTLEKTKGNTDWEMGLIDSLMDLAKSAPKETLNILEQYLTRSNPQQEWLHMRLAKDLKEVLEVIYAKDEYKQGIYQLINKLLPRGNGRFWDLQEIVKGYNPNGLDISADKG